MLTYIVIGLAVLATGYALYLRSTRRALLKRMARGVDIIKAGIGCQLLRKYVLKYSGDTPAKLASAVTNELFSDPPGTHEAALFLEENAALVRKEISALRSDKETRDALTQALRVRAMVAFAKGKDAREDLIEPLEKIRKLKLLMPGGDQPSNKTFFALVQRYYSLIGADS